MPADAPSDRYERLEQVVERFETACRLGERPSIESFLAAATTAEERRHWLVELVHADLECRIAAGEAAHAEEYFARFAELAGDEKNALDLLIAEFELCSRHDPDISWDHLIARFPQFQSQLLEHSTVGKFRLQSRLGEGNFGVVWKAMDLELERVVAVKIPHPGRVATRKDVERFLREGRSLARLHHPGIVAVYEVGDHRAMPFLVSEYVTGKSLAKVMNETALSSRDAADLVRQVAEALDYAHGLGVIHRDIKPSNIMLRQAPSDAPGPAAASVRWQAKLTDFGLSRRIDIDRTLTRDGDVLGTPAYMTPEQAAGDLSSMDGRSDVYSLGGVLYRLLAGREPFRGSASSIMHQVLHSDPPPIRRLNPAAPRDLEAVCLKCLEKTPGRRYPTARALADDLGRYLNNEPTDARPAGWWRRSSHWARRRPAIAALCLVSLMATAGVLGANLWRLRQLEQALVQSNALRDTADRERTRASQADNHSRSLLYASRMRHAQQAWQEGNYARVQQILGQYADGTQDAHLRHFEWYHLNYLCRVPHVELPGHEGEAYAVAYAQGDNVLLTGGQDGTVRIWDAAQGKSLAVLRDHASCVNSIDVAPDGDTFVTASCDKTIKLWSLKRRQALRTLTGHSREVDCCTFVDEGRLLISVSRGLLPDAPREARLWDADTGAIRTEWPPMDEKFHWVSWSRSGKTIVTSDNTIVTVWRRNGDAWKAARRFGGVDTGGAAYVAPDEANFVVPGWPSRVWTYRLEDGGVVDLQDARGGSVLGVAFSPDGKLLATCAESLRVWSFPAGTQRASFCSGIKVWHAAWAPSNESIASVGSDGVARIWSLNRGSPCVALQPPPGHADSALGFGYLRDGRSVNVAYRMQNLTWNLESGRLTPDDQVAGKISERPSEAVVATNEASESERLGGSWNLLPQWDPRSSVLRDVLPPRSEKDAEGPLSARIVESGDRIVEVGGNWSGERRLDAKEQTTVRRPLPENHALARVLDISLDGTLFCALRQDGKTAVFDRRRNASVELADAVYPNRAQFAPTANRVLIGNREFDAATGQVVRVWDAAETNRFAYSADGRRIAFSVAYARVAIVDAETGEETLSLDAPEGVEEVLFAPDGTSLLLKTVYDEFYVWPGKR